MNALVQPEEIEQAIEIELPISGIYAILNIYNDKFYIGSSKNIKKRWRVHRNDLKQNYHDNTHLQHSYNKYWINPFIFIVIEYCEIQKLIEREQFYIDTLKPDYNFRKIASSNLGLKYSEEAKIKMRKPKSEKAKINMSFARKGKKQSKLHIENMMKAKANGRGFSMSEETKRKIGEANSIALKGHKHSEETKHKMSEARKKFLNSSPIYILVP